jgi:hydrogenase expression/formation protein HypC
MCLAVPGRIIEIDGQNAKVDFGGVTREANLMLMEDAAVGEYVLIHAGFAIQRLNAEEAEETLRLYGELARALEKDDERKK